MISLLQPVYSSLVGHIGSVETFPFLGLPSQNKCMCGTRGKATECIKLLVYTTVPVFDAFHFSLGVDNYANIVLVKMGSNYKLQLCNDIPSK